MKTVGYTAIRNIFLAFSHLLLFYSPVQACSGIMKNTKPPFLRISQSRVVAAARKNSIPLWATDKTSNETLLLPGRLSRALPFDL